jgi:hypothetical protein
MRRRQPWLRAAAVALVWAGATGCTSGQGGSAAEPKPYVRPAGWATECVGRYQFDAPAPIRVGQTLPEWGAEGKMRYRLEPAAGKLGGGGVDISGLRMFETSPVKDLDAYGYIDERADFHYRIRVIRDGGPSEARAERARTTQRYALRWPTSFVWRSDEDLDFGVLMPEDRRARMIHGYPADKGEFPNNISGDKARDMFESLWSRFKVRAPGEIPSQPGFCTPFGFFVDPPGAAEENYYVGVTFLPPGYQNLVMGVTVATLRPRPWEPSPDERPIDQQETPWEAEDRRVREAKANCKQGPATTASRDLFGCTLAGTRDITGHRDVEYIELGDGRKARLLVVKYFELINDGAVFDVTVETSGKIGSATEPRVLVYAVGFSGKVDAPAFKGKQPPEIDDVVALVKTIARSARLRPGAVEPGAAVRDTTAPYR